MKQPNFRGIALGNYIRKLRTSRGISTEAMAAALKISERNYIQYEEGSVSIYVEHLMIVSSILDVDIKHLLEVFEKPGKPTWI
ncbi:TPA: helix-turn-helix transcriptional regulator [Providencia stuartii]|uniref:Helix-turn-helix transcriptional regulator n=4 Tax=Providencia stuartii TaxID=588 RepID=A0AAJ1JGD6_PROST|nr:MULTISPECIES: helix-turn-helix transcriptional regulator [Providencia]SST03054.1 anaerobic benzoate catabolism transcriptional regulator [Acinetobacter baumannii]AFH95744.1 hypothetical protein S70_19755 [Providencia stuartii MRSN 2154]AIN63562.1 helix-turn-helix family protein [Providencia stuartii]AMG66152.1 XRE family transcriptional regulator [Providencia stuartii]APG49748.1 transcriptional regulator [Providencia stuartii]